MKKYDFFKEETFPESLGNEELMNYFEKMHNGDKQAREIIISHNIRLVLSLIFKKFINSPYEINELFSIGLIGLIKAVDTFNISKKIKFSTYAFICINNEIIMFMRKDKKTIKTLSFDNSIFTDEEENNFTVEDILSDETDLVLDYEKKETIQIIKELVENLKDREKEIIKLYFGFYNDKKYSQREIAKKFNTTQTTVSRTIKKILKKFSIILQQQGIIEKNPNKKKFISI